MSDYIALTGTLQFTTAVHIGSGKAGETTDAPLRRDARGRIVLPGTAIAGALRATATRLAPRIDFRDDTKKLCLAFEKEKNDEPCHCHVCHLFGDVNPGVGEEGEQESEKLTHASRLWIYDAVVAAGQAGALVRDGVGIDRRSGVSASASGAKFDLEVLPAGTCFKLRMELKDTDEQDHQLLAATLAEWQAGRGRLGGRTARGLGAFELTDLKCTSLDLSDPEKLMNYLTTNAPWESEEVETGWVESNLSGIGRRSIEELRDVGQKNEAIARCWVTVTFELQFTGPFLMHDPVLANLVGFDHAPLLQQLPPANRDGWQPRPVLSGAGLRGVLRSHAERIARTLATHHAWKKSTDFNARRKAFLQTCPACDPLQSKEGEALASCDTLLAKDPESGKTVLSTTDLTEDKHLCLGCWLFGSTRRGSRLAVDDAALAEGQEPNWKVQDFLAIDRFTGGALETAKFDAVDLIRPRFTVRLHLENPEAWELGWLTLVLRDLRDELVTFGFGAAKGYGLAKAEKFNVQMGFIDAGDLPLWQREGDEAQALQSRKKAFAEDASAEYNSLYTIRDFDETSFQSYKPILEDWVKAFHEKLEKFKRAGAEGSDMQLPALVKDTYFDGELPSLYPLNPDLG